MHCSWYKNAFITFVLMGLMGFSAHAADTERVSLKGGGQLLVLRDESVPVVNLRITFEGAGASADTLGSRGLAYLTSQMIMEGAGARDADAFQDALAEHAIDMHASVDKDNLTISITALREQVPFAISLLGDALTRPRLDSADMARVRERTVAQLARLSEQPSYRADRLLAEQLFARHPYSNPQLGVAEEIARLEPQDITSFMQTYMTSGNILVAAAGDTDASLLEELLDEMVVLLAENEIGPVPVARAAFDQLGATVRAQADVPQTVIMFALPWVSRSDDNFYASYILSTLLGGQGLSSLLMQDLRETDGLVYSVSTGLDLARGANMLVGVAATRNDKADEVMQRISDRLRLLQQSGPAASRCTTTKTYLAGRMQLELDNTAAQADMLRMMQLNDLPENYLDKRVQAIEAVSCADITRVAASLLNPENLTFAVVGGAAPAAKAP